EAGDESRLRSEAHHVARPRFDRLDERRRAATCEDMRGAAHVATRVEVAVEDNPPHEDDFAALAVDIVGEAGGERVADLRRHEVDVGANAFWLRMVARDDDLVSPGANRDDRIHAFNSSA